MVILLVAVALSAFSGCGRKKAEGPKADKTASASKLGSLDKSSPRYLIEQAFLAHGGDKIAAVQAGEISIHLIVHREGNKFNDSKIHSKFQRPEKLRRLEIGKVSNETEEGTFVKDPKSQNSVNTYLRVGDRAWMKSENLRYRDVLTLHEIDRLQPFETITELREYIDSDLDFNFLESETLAGRPADLIEFSKEGTLLGTLAFDKETHLLVEFSKPTYDPRREQDVMAYNRYSDFQTVDGITYPTKMISHLDEFFFLEQTVEELKLHDKLDDEYFKLPK